MKRKYNTKVVQYIDQVNVSIFDGPIVIKDDYDNMIIYLKRFRSIHSKLIYDNGDGTGIFECDNVLLDNEKNKYVLEHGAYKKTLDNEIPNVYTSYIISDNEKQERNTISSLNRTKSKVYDLSYNNNWSHFITLTFNDNLLIQEYGNGSWDYDVCCKALHQYLVDLRRKFKDVSYLGVPEQHNFYYDVNTLKKVYYNGYPLRHKEDYTKIFEKVNRTKDEQDIVDKVQNGTYQRRFHFHFLFNNYPSSQLTISTKRNGKPRRTKSGLIIYNLDNYKWGYTTATEVQNLSATQHYITKYISKDLVSVSKGRKRYWASKNLNKPFTMTYDLTKLEKESLITNLYNVVQSDSRKKKVEVKVNDYENVIHKYVVLNNELGNDNISQLANGYYVDEDENDSIPEYTLLGPSEEEIKEKQRFDTLILKKEIEQFKNAQDEKAKQFIEEMRARQKTIEDRYVVTTTTRL